MSQSFTQPLANIVALAAQFTQSAQPDAAPRAVATLPFADAFRLVILEVADVDPAMYHADATLREDLALDSLDMIELIMICEKDFGIVIKDREWMKAQTVADLQVLVAKQIQKMAAQVQDDSSPMPAAS